MNNFFCKFYTTTVNSLSSTSFPHRLIKLSTHRLEIESVLLYLQSWPVCWAESQAPSSLVPSRSAEGERDEWETSTTERNRVNSFFDRGDSPSVCVVCSRLSCSVWLSRCPRPSALLRWSGPGGTSWAGQPDTGGIAVPTGACWVRRGGGAPSNACDQRDGRQLSRLQTWGWRVIMDPYEKDQLDSKCVLPLF